MEHFNVECFVSKFRGIDDYIFLVILAGMVRASEILTFVKSSFIEFPTGFSFTCTDKITYMATARYLLFGYRSALPELLLQAITIFVRDGSPEI